MSAIPGLVAAPSIIYNHGDPTDLEQYLIELINRARKNPTAEGVFLDTLDTAYSRSARRDKPQFFTNLRQEFASYPVAQPLAFNSCLLKAARGHAADMVARNYYSHTNLQGLLPWDRAKAAGYPSQYVGENISGQGATSAADMLEIHYGLMVDAYNLSQATHPLGHRLNILNTRFSEIGLGEAGSAVNGKAVQDFGDNGQVFIVGVVYKDANNNGFYDPGEGLANLTVTPSQGLYYAITSASGGYAIPLEPFETRSEKFQMNIPAAGGWTDAVQQQDAQYRAAYTAANKVLISLTLTMSGEGLSTPIIKQLTIIKPILVNYTLVGTDRWYFSQTMTVGASIKADFTPSNVPPPAPPRIVTQPQSQTVTVGQNVTFTVSASSNPAPTYQWYFNSKVISGATSASYMISNVQMSHAGNYFVILSNASGTATSATVVLTVNIPSPPTPPRIITQPQSQTVTVGQNVIFTVFTVSASGNPALSYQWYRNDVPLSGAKGASLTFANAQSTDAGTVYVIVSNSQGSVKSETAVLTVEPAATAPAITMQPASQAVREGSNVTLTITASGSQPLSYQWYRNNSVITGATAASYTTSGVQTSDAGSYNVRVSNSFGTVDSAAAILTLQVALNKYTDDFESGKFDKLPWTFGGNAPWQTISNGVASGLFAARSGAIGDNQRSSLFLAIDTLMGTGSFDLRVSSEEYWDNLEFYLNGKLLEIWSGEVSWRNYQFQILTGRNTLEWRYQKDKLYSEGEDVAYIDNLYLPMAVASKSPPQLSIIRSTNNQVSITLKGEASVPYVLQTSADLKFWTSVVTNQSDTGVSQWQSATNSPHLFYRALGQ